MGVLRDELATSYVLVILEVVKNAQQVSIVTQLCEQFVLRHILQALDCNAEVAFVRIYCADVIMMSATSKIGYRPRL